MSSIKPYDQEIINVYSLEGYYDYLFKLMPPFSQLRKVSNKKLSKKLQNRYKMILKLLYKNREDLNDYTAILIKNKYLTIKYPNFNKGKISYNKLKCDPEYLKKRYGR